MFQDKNVLFQKSSFLRMIRTKNKAIIWHSLFGNPKIISVKALNFLNLFGKPRSISSIFVEYQIGRNEELIIDELMKFHYLVSVGLNERNFLIAKKKEYEKRITNGSLINYLGLVVSEKCNFRCVYCILSSNLEKSDRLKQKPGIMKFQTAKTAIDWFLSVLQQNRNKVAKINFGGGEPLFAWNTIKKILEYCKKVYSKQFEFIFSINTNASLITDEIAKTLRDYRVGVAASLDGLSEDHNKVRIDKLGNGTFDIVTKGFDKLAEHNYPLDGFSITVNEYNLSSIDERIIDWAIKRHMKEIRIDIDVVNMVNIPIKDVVKRLVKLLRYAREREISIPGFWARPVENLNDSFLDEHIGFCGASRGNSICVNPSGEIYPCGYSNAKIGKLQNMDSFFVANGDYHHFVMNHFVGEIESCKGCIIEGQCIGGCNITREVSTLKKDSKFEWMCSFYHKMTEELLREELQSIKI